MKIKTGHVPGEKLGLIFFFNPLQCLETLLSSLHKNYKVLLSSAKNAKRCIKLTPPYMFQQSFRFSSYGVEYLWVSPSVIYNGMNV